MRSSYFVGRVEQSETRQFLVELWMMLSFKGRVSSLYPTYNLKATFVP